MDKSTLLSKYEIAKRLNILVTSLGWIAAISILKQKNVLIENLNVIELGCGTGTFSLSLGLMGAKVTLFDIDADILRNTERIFNSYGLNPNCIQGNVLDKLPDSLDGKFDLAISLGLAEHFRGINRIKCLKFHRDMLREGGLAYISVPNKYSPFYQLMRLIKVLSGTWVEKYEEPFCYNELKKDANSVGFNNYLIKGNHFLLDDFFVYSRTYIADILSWKVKKIFIKNKFTGDSEAYRGKDITTLIKNKFADTRPNFSSYFEHVYPRDYFSAGIVLFGFR